MQKLLLMQMQLQELTAMQPEQMLLQPQLTAVQRILQEVLMEAVTDPKAMTMAPVIPVQQSPILQDLQMNSFPTQMRQEPSIVTLTDIRL